MPNEIYQTWFFKQSPQEVWEYLTNPFLLEQWLAKTDFQPKAGHKFHLTDKSCKITNCEVLEVKPFSRLSYSWQFTSANDKKLFNSKVVWTLAPKKNGTELQLAHTGFTAVEDFVAPQNGWETCLKRFDELINTNKK